MLLRFTANDVDVFQSRAAIKTEIREILSEKSDALAEKKNRDQREHDNRDQRVASEEGFDQRLARQPPPARGGVFQQDRAGSCRTDGDSFHIFTMRNPVAGG